MSNDNLIAFQPPESSTSFNAALSELVRQGARQMIAQAVETELQEFLGHYQDLKDAQGRQAVDAMAICLVGNAVGFIKL
jgi:hypothetical protein